MTLFYSTFFNGIFFFFFQAYLSFSLSEINHGFPRFSRVCFARGIRKIHRSVFIETREGGEPLPSETKSFFVPRPSRKGKGGRGESLREGEGEKHASSHVQLFSNALHAKDAKDCCSPFHLAPLSPTPARIRSWKFGSSRDSTTRP